MAHSELHRAYDELLVTLARSGDRRAGERLAARWHPRLLKTAKRLLRDDEQAKDAVQEAWAGICKGWLTLSDPARFPAWAFGILNRKCADRIKAEIRQRDHFEALDRSAEQGIEPPDVSLTEIDRALATLPLDQRTTAILFFGEGLTLREIAIATSVPLGTAKSRIFKARQHLRAIFKGEET